MLALQQHPNLIEKTFTDRLGRRFRMVFMVTAVNGELKGRLVSVQPLSPEARPKQISRGEASVDILYLPVVISNKVVETAYIPAYAPIVSPFNEMYFFVSQPTRAPSHK